MMNVAKRFMLFVVALIGVGHVSIHAAANGQTRIRSHFADAGCNVRYKEFRVDLISSEDDLLADNDCATASDAEKAVNGTDADEVAAVSDAGASRFRVVLPCVLPSCCCARQATSTPTSVVPVASPITGLVLPSSLSAFLYDNSLPTEEIFADNITEADALADMGSIVFFDYETFGDGNLSDVMVKQEIVTPTEKRKHSHQCDYAACAKCFRSHSDLMAHMRTHTGEKPFKCSFAPCTKAFAHRSNVLAHERSHQNIKLYSCQVCNRSFAHPASRNDHQKKCYT